MLMIFMLVIGWAVFAYWLGQQETPTAYNLRKRQLTLLGLLLSVGGYFLTAWIRFDLLKYIRLPLIQWLEPFISQEMIIFLGGLLENDAARWFFQVCGFLTRWNALTLQAIPSLNLWSRLAILLPIFPMALAFVLVPIASVSPDTCFSKGIGLSVSVLGLFAAFFLAFRLTDIAALSLSQNLEATLVIVLLGAELDSGPWICILGLLLLGIGGALEFLPDDRIAV